MAKPYDGQDCGGAFHNFPLAFDATATPIESPIAAGETKDLVVHSKAGRINLLATGSNAATVTIKTGSTAEDGVITIPNNVQVAIDCGGMSDPNNSGVPNIISVTAGATSPVSFWFDSTTATGE